MAYSDKGDILDLTAKVDNSGILNWIAAAGNWKLYAVFQGWHGKMVERAAPGGETNVIDHFWLPKWCGNQIDPSARVLDMYNKDENVNNC